MKIVYLSLWSNLGDREKALQDAIKQLESKEFRIKRLSGIYETRPMDLVNQPWFLNMVVEAECDLLPMQLLSRTQSVERNMGRKRIVSKGPRNIDIDILFHGAAVVNTRQLEIPHPWLAERRFVLEPLAELAPELRHPVTRRSVREMLAETVGQTVTKLQ